MLTVVFCGTGLFSPDGDNGGYSKYGKQQVVKYLRAVEREARKHLQISSCKLIPHARIPLLKLETSSGTELDVSINDAGGVSAANFLQSWVRKGPQWFGLALCASSSEA